MVTKPHADPSTDETTHGRSSIKKGGNNLEVHEAALELGFGPEQILTPRSPKEVQKSSPPPLSPPTPSAPLVIACVPQDSFLEAIRTLKPDLCVTAAYGGMLPQRFLDIPRLGSLNIHPSLLPRFECPHLRQGHT